MKIYNRLTGKNIEVEVTERYYTLNGERLYRVETKGRTGVKKYINGSYLYKKVWNDENSLIVESPVYGMNGATGHGWGGSICGYITKEEAIACGLL